MDLEDLKDELQDQAYNVQGSVIGMEDLVGLVGGQVSSDIRRSIHHLQEALEDINLTIEKISHLTAEEKKNRHRNGKEKV